MSKITRMPGGDCRFFRQGRCLYEERLNPGYHGQWRCGVVRRLEDDYDDFVYRAERFDILDKTAGAIWEKRFKEMIEAGPTCPRLGGQGESFMDCTWLAGDICLLELPECSGICRRFEPGGTEDQDGK